MSDTSRQASWEDVLDLVERLKRHGARFLLVGGFALAAHGYSRATFDVDIAVDPTPENAPNWVAALAELPDGAAKVLVQEENPFAGDTLHAIRINDAISVDVMPSVAGLRFDELLEHATTVHVEGVAIPILDLHGLLKTKQGDRDKDRADAAILREAIALLGESQDR